MKDLRYGGDFYIEPRIYTNDLELTYRKAYGKTFTITANWFD